MSYLQKQKQYRNHEKITWFQSKSIERYWGIVQVQTRRLRNDWNTLRLCAATLSDLN